MTLSDDKITGIFCQVDTFCFHFHNALAPQILGNPPKKEAITLGQRSHHPHDLIPSQRLSHHEGILQELREGTHAAPFPQDRFL